MPPEQAQPPAPTPTPLAVIDTNVVLDLLLFDDARARWLRLALEARQVLWVGTEPMLAELADVLTRPFAAGRAVGTLAQARAMCQLVTAPDPTAPAQAPVPQCSDADDQKFIDLAVSLRCRWLYTRDLALLRLKRAAAIRGVTVQRPQDGERNTPLTNTMRHGPTTVPPGQSSA